LTVLEQAVEKLEKHIHDIHPTTAVGQVALTAAEHVLKGLEEKLLAKIKSLGTFAILKI